MGTTSNSVYGTRLGLDSANAPGGVLAYHADGDMEIVHINQYLVNLLECESTDEALQLVDGSFRGFVSDEDFGVVQDAVWHPVAQGDGTSHVRYRVRTKSGKLVSVDDFGRLIDCEGERPIIRSSIFVVTQDHPMDWLTGLLGISRFYDFARQEADEVFDAGSHPVAVALNLMGLKAHSARYGHERGDELLCQFADALRRHFDMRTCTRLAEDQFYAVCDMATFWKRVNGLFDDFEHNDAGVFMPIRVGAYECEPGDDIVSFGFERAKLACDLGHETWQSHVTWFTYEMRENENRRMYLISSLDKAIANGWIRPYYQPIVRAATGDVCGEEALARWMDPQYGDLLPRQFFSVLDEAGLSHKLDMHIVDCVLEDIQEKRRQGVSVVPVSVNISARDLTQLDVPTALAQKTAAMGVSPNLVRIEISESVISSDVEFLRRQIQALHQAGFEVWMDDYGTGFSSLYNLHKLEFDNVKLDMGLFRDAWNDRSKVVVEGLVQTLRKLGIGTVAEGVETEEKALFLEEVGCDMLQGYFIHGPESLSKVVDDAHATANSHREAAYEADYWESVNLFNLVGFSAMAESQVIDGVPTSEFPTGVLELRRGEWRVVRANRLLRDIFVQEGFLTEAESSLRVSKIAIQDALSEFQETVYRCNLSGAWERIPGGIEYGTGYQYYVKPVASSPDAEAYVVMGIPTLLGTALGAYGDVPVAYAVFRVIVDEATDKVMDAQYVYANALYCDWKGLDQKEVVGRSYLDVSKGTSGSWFPYFRRAVITGEHVHDVVYSNEINHWLSFYIAPSTIPGYCVYAFAIADDEHREREAMTVGLDTSDRIIDIANDMNGELHYDVAMNELLEKMGTIIQADRLYVLERDEYATNNTFEWCAEGVATCMAARQGIPNEDIDEWARLFSHDSMVLIQNVDLVRMMSERLYARLSSKGVTRVFMVPCVNNGVFVGYIGADNFTFDKDLDSRRLFKTIASFAGAKIANHKLVKTLEAASMHDGLTDLLNRRGIDLSVDSYLKSHPGQPYVISLMDIDDFKTVNDRYGHEVGDEALRTFARIVTETLPEGTIIGRNGGDEFFAMLIGEHVQNADAIMENLAMQDMECVYGGKRYQLSMSIGYAAYPDDATSLQNAYSHADAALYSVKLQGKCGFSRYAPQMDTQYRSQLGFTPRDIAENVPGSIVVHRPTGDGEILFANEELVRLFECDDLADFMSLTGGIYRGIIHPDDRERVQHELEDQEVHIEMGGKDHVNFRILTKRGNVRHVSNIGQQVEVEGMGKVFYELMVSVEEPQ